MNSEYKKLAYERAVLMALVNVAKEKFLPVEGEDAPEVPIECEELPRSESQVPEDAVIEVVLRLQRLAAMRELEMTKYTHVAMEKNDEQEWTEAEKPTVQSGSQKSGAPGKKGKSKGGGGSPQASAAGGGGQRPAHPTAPATAQRPARSAQ